MQVDSLQRLVSYAIAGGWSAVQLRKAVVNTSKNQLTSCQAMEMAMDAVIQQGRLISGGVVELRGNGQLLNRTVLDKAGGFNEDTVTDDLDLSFRLLISGSLVGILWDPPVYEEAVETIPALWRQRKRWAEGGLQRLLAFIDFKQTDFSSEKGLVLFLSSAICSSTHIFLGFINHYLYKNFSCLLASFDSCFEYFRISLLARL